MAESNITPIPRDQTHFGDVFSKLWSVFKKKPFQFIIIQLFPFIFGMGIGLFITFFTGGSDDISTYFDTTLMGIISISIFVLLLAFLMILQIIMTGMTFSLAHELENGKASMAAAFKTAFFRIGSAILLSFRIFFYTFTWLFILAIPLSILIAQVVPQNNSTLLAGMIFFPAIFINLLVVIVIRSLETAFAFPLLYGKEKVTSKQALQKSIELAKNRLGRIFVNYLLLGLLAIGIYIVYMMIVFAVAGPFLFSNSTDFMDLAQSGQASTYNDLFTLPVSFIFSLFGQLFQFAFLKKMQEEKGEV